MGQYGSDTTFCDSMHGSCWDNDQLHTGTLATPLLVAHPYLHQLAIIFWPPTCGEQMHQHILACETVVLLWSAAPWACPVCWIATSHGACSRKLSRQDWAREHPTVNVPTRQDLPCECAAAGHPWDGGMCNSKHDGRTKTPTPGNVQHESQVTCYGSLSLAQCQTLFFFLVVSIYNINF